jgi:hypothetical protein
MHNTLIEAVHVAAEVNVVANCKSRGGQRWVDRPFNFFQDSGALGYEHEFICCSMENPIAEFTVVEIAARGNGRQ